MIYSTKCKFYKNYVRATMHEDCCQIQNQNRVVVYVAVYIIHYTVFVNNLKKSAFQLKAHIPLADTMSNTYNWNDLDLEITLTMVVTLTLDKKVKLS